MTQTPQSIRKPKTLTDLDFWRKCKLPVDVNSVTKSKTFMKKVVSIAFSNICYLRTNFPEDAFHSYNFGRRQSCRVLKESFNDAANTMLKNLQGAFEAYDRGYLHKVEIVIKDGDNEDSAVIETYTFNFRPCDGQEFLMTMLQGTKEGVYKNIDVSSSMNDPSARTTGMELMRKATRLLMRELSVAVEGLNMLPDTAVMEMHLEYSPDTPVDYSAPGFEDTNQAVKIAGPPEEIFNKKFNPLPTPYHKMQLKMKSRLVGSQKINSAEAPPVVNTTSQMEDHSQMEQGEEDDLDTTVPVDEPHNASHAPTDFDNTIGANKTDSTVRMGKTETSFLLAGSANILPHSSHQQNRSKSPVDPNEVSTEPMTPKSTKRSGKKATATPAAQDGGSGRKSLYSHHNLTPEPFVQSPQRSAKETGYETMQRDDADNAGDADENLPLKRKGQNKIERRKRPSGEADKENRMNEVAASATYTALPALTKKTKRMAKTPHSERV